MSDPRRVLVERMCAAVQEALDAGEARVVASLSREVGIDSGAVVHEFVIVEGFQCARPTCTKPTHVYVRTAPVTREYDPSRGSV